MNKKIILLVMSLFIFTGCIKADLGLELNKDGSGQVFVIMGLEKQLLSMTDEDVTEEMAHDFEQEGFDVTAYEDDTYQGIEARKTFDDINTFSFDENEEGSSFEWTKDSSLFRNTYTLRGTADTSEADLGEVDPLMADRIEFNFIVKMPISPDDHNATTVDGNTLTWELNLDEEMEFYVEASEINLLSILVGLFFIIVIIAIYLNRRKVRARQQLEQTMNNSNQTDI